MEHKPLILYIEDDAMNRALVKRVLEHCGYMVEVAEDGSTGLQWARALRPDLILMDIGMPGTNGYEATKLIKADPQLAAIPVIALTAYAMRGDRERALEAGCEGYIPKPIDVATFPVQVERYLRLTAPLPAAPGTSSGR
jgi:two-component system cell cycle response regulator DivK